MCFVQHFIMRGREQSDSQYDWPVSLSVISVPPVIGRWPERFGCVLFLVELSKNFGGSELIRDFRGLNGHQKAVRTGTCVKTSSF